MSLKMCFRGSRIAALAIFSATAVTTVVGQTGIPVVNFNFETGGFAGDGNSSNPGVIPSGWSAFNSGLSGAYFGYFNPNNGVYSGTTGSGNIGSMSGPNLFYFGSATGGQGIEQTLSTSFAADIAYTLTLGVGARSGGYMASVEMDLLAGNTVLASRTVFNPTLNTFSDFSLTYAPDAANDNLVGQALKIRFLEIDNQGPNGVEADIDNVRLTAATVPEPSTLSVAAAGLGVLGWYLRRRRQ